MNGDLATITTIESKRKYEVYWRGHTLKRQHDVAIVVKVDTNVEVIEVIRLNARVIVLDAVLYGCSARVINCYAPTEDSTKITNKLKGYLVSYLIQFVTAGRQLR